jgi:hypothetical protein
VVAVAVVERVQLVAQQPLTRVVLVVLALQV